MKTCRSKMKFFLILLCFVINMTSLKAQLSDTIQIDLKWNGIEKVDFGLDTINRISLEDAVYDLKLDEKLPLYKYCRSVYDDNVDVSFDMIVTDFEPVPDEELKLLSIRLDTVPYCTYYITNSRDNSNLCFEIVPFFTNKDGVMRVKSCKLSYSLRNISRKLSNSYVENSVLSTGKWYKMSLSSTGMYKITYHDLLSMMGASINSINPKNIRIYHNGGGVLPNINSDERHEDLVEIPIYIHGENDGSFDENDYIVFYGRGPVTWKYNGEAYDRVVNPYSDYSYVFLTADLGEGKRIVTSELISDDADMFVNSFVDYQLKEEDNYNLNNMGATWYYDIFDAVTTRSYSFDFPNLIKEKKCVLNSEVASRNTSSSASFRFEVNGKQVSQLNFSKITSNYMYARTAAADNVKFSSSQDAVKVDLTYVKSGSSSMAWLDYISVNAWRELKFVGNEMAFRNPECNDSAKVYGYEIVNSPNSMQVWDVTNPVEPKKMSLEYSSNKVSFKVYGNEENEFVAFNDNELKTPAFVSAVQNQNLHSKYDFDFLIVTHPDFYTQAQRLKGIHSRIDDLEIEIVTPMQIYNEFSCGAQDITAIRDYIKMIYDKSDKRLRYVLLFGDASYDYRNKSGNVCFVPTYESIESCSVSTSIVTDDYFACMDPDEGDMESSGDAIDIAIGRIPVSTYDDAVAMVDKIERYVSNEEESMGSWRKLITFVTDDERSFMSHAEQLQSIVRSEVGDDVNFDKIYLDAYPQIASSSGQRAPECNAAITNRVEAGSLIVDYIGHAGEVGWADERILTNEDINSWRNSPKLHFMITASCEFTRFDDHTRTSAGEYVFLNHHGGAIAMISAARVSYGSNNQTMFSGFYRHLFDVEDGEYIKIGDVYVFAKHVGDVNSRNYLFLGDPALRFNFPKNKVEITSINNHEVTVIDTLKALQKSNVKGVVKDVYGNLMTDFNGTLQINIYDKENSYTTYGDQNDPFTFQLRDNIVYSGKVPVVNGEFSADFTLPKDINYSYGNGLMSFYAYSDKTDAQGSYSDFIVGGLNHDAVPDENGPEIKLFIDDVKFVDGSMTNENPVLIAYIKDINGINTSSAGIGHDITATLSGATNKTYSLNQYYDAPIYVDEFGTLSYKFYNLNEGEHQLTFRVWDIYNNSSTATINFNVVKGNVVNIKNVMNYPNPMSEYTNFTFEHNQKDNEIDVVIRLYNIMGQLVKTIEEHRYGTTARIEPIRWNGTSDSGNKLPSGIYVYYVTITNSQNEQTSGYSKLIIE